MSDGAADTGGLLGRVLGTSIGFVLWIYDVRYMYVLVERLGAW